MAGHQASSSALSYEVFLSFYGIDVGTNFVDHLYNALVYAGIRTFREENELQNADKIGPELLAAIQQSRIFILIFSENYASSKRCLDVLIEISECTRTTDQIVLPIFYKVEPRDVRYQIGTYKNAFEEHQKHLEEGTMQKWKKALKEVGNLDGWHSKEGMYEGKLIKEVVKNVWSALSKGPLIGFENPVGIQSHISEMLMLLDIESDNKRIVGIHGIGGLGKTTIARMVYDKVFPLFEGCSFIENIQENAEKHGLPHLQNQLMYDILKKEKNITRVDDGINLIQQSLCQRKVLVVLDDVDQDNQIKSLVGDLKWFGIGSKIIITTRNEEILIGQKVDGIYKPDVMNFNDSLGLFSHHAFGRDQPPEDYLDLSKDIVKTTGGLPLALQVIGSSLYLKGKPVWESMSKKLGKVPNNDVMKRLKISYDGLDDEEQQMFLDIACFFIGMTKDIACPIWDGCGFSSEAGLDALLVRSLITMNEKGVLRMHDQLRDLGRLIVHQECTDEPGECSRLWSQEDVLEVLDTQTGTSKVKGFSIDFRDKSKSQCLMSEGFTTMKRLRLLQVDYAHFSGNLFGHPFSELRWLSWKGCPNLQCAQTNFCPRKLVVLDLSDSEITENWMGWKCIKMAVNLKVLNLMSCSQLSRSPDISANRRLEVLNLADSVNLVEIDKSIGYLCNLVIFDMSGCVRLVNLPIEICGLNSLKALALAGCKSLVNLPVEICQLTNLEMLNLRECEKVLQAHLPLSLSSLDVRDCKSIGCISGLSSSSILETLDLTRCESLVELPTEICHVTSVKRMDLGGCSKLLCISNLPLSLTSLNIEHCSSIHYISGLPPSLTSLNVKECSSIRYISDLPSSLTSLHVVICDRLEKLSSTSGLVNLETFVVDSCYSLKEIEGIDGGSDSLVIFRMAGSSVKKMPTISNSKRLRKLGISECQISHFPEALNLIALEELIITDCRELTLIPSLDRLVSLRKLEIAACDALREIPDLSNLNNLTDLTLKYCRNITKIHSLGSLEFLVNLDIQRCLSLETIPDLSNLKNLTDVEIWSCSSITEIRGVDRLELLERLNVSLCGSLESLPDLSNLKKLQRLSAKGCAKLTEIHCVNTLEFLAQLDIDWCASLERIPDLRNFKNLKEIKAYGCTKLTQIHGLDGLELLESLDIRECESLERLPDLSKLKNLNYLPINRCKKLREIHSLGILKCLEKLDFEGCESLERLPDLSILINLRELRANCCKKLTNIDGVDWLKFLKELNIGGCESLEVLPDLSNLGRLKLLGAYGCKRLTAIQAVNGLKSLELLDIRGCISLEKIPPLTYSTEFCSLNGEDCWGSTEIKEVYRFRVELLTDHGRLRKLQLDPDLSNLTRTFSDEQRKDHLFMQLYDFRCFLEYSFEGAQLFVTWHSRMWYGGEAGIPRMHSNPADVSEDAASTSSNPAAPTSFIWGKTAAPILDAEVDTGLEVEDDDFHFYWKDD